ncbi:ATP-binding protein [Kordiimonas gwangyangensis]|nr:ATP-binding protein [Kordiimonas gwangyangensis]
MLEKGLALDIRGLDALPRKLYGDPTRLSQIIINLANNAVKFTERGSVTITVSCTDRTDGKAFLNCAVTDTGIGMTEEEKGRLFQSFSQADETIARRYGGTGLGLAICKQLVEMMDGHISVESTPGVGSTFKFNLLLDLPEANAPQQAQTNGEPAGASVSLKGAHILLAEDNPVNRMIALKLLDAAGIKTDVAEDGLEAVSRASATRYDAILMDLQMPGLDGTAAAAKLRETDISKQVPIIAMTANVSEKDRELCMKAGMNDHIPKPFKPDELYATLAKWLN